MRSPVTPLTGRPVLDFADSMKSHAVARTEEERLAAIRIVRPDRTAADQTPPARGLSWIDTGLPGGDRHRPGRDLQTRRFPAWHGDAGIDGRHVGETGNETDDEHPVFA